jgi:uncharacterized protein (UPF0335 family)
MPEMPVGDNAKAQLLSYIERVERLKEERKGINDDIKDVKAEAKGNGFNPKMIERMIAERAKETQKRLEEQAEFDTYAAAIGLAMQ